MRLPHARQAASLVGKLVLGWMCAATYAQTIYRCGSNYSDTPCAGGAPLVINDSRSLAQKAQTDAATVQTRALAEQLERDRQALERSAMRSAAPATRRTGDTPNRPPSSPADANAPKTAKNTRKKQTEPAFFTAAAAADKKSKASSNTSD